MYQAIAGTMTHDNYKVSLKRTQTKREDAGPIPVIEVLIHLNPDLGPQDLLDAITEIKAYVGSHFPQSMLTWGTISSVSSSHNPDMFLTIVHTKDMHTIMSKASFTQQLAYIQAIGYVPDKCFRHSNYLAAVKAHYFNNGLLKLGIQNSFPPKQSFKRIFAVHPDYFQDAEVSAGLGVNAKSHEADHTVFVGSPEMLSAALDSCEPGTTLVLYGHWEHEKKSTFGVWQCLDATSIAEGLSRCISKDIQKISHLILYGCWSGKLSDDLSLPGKFFFKENSNVQHKEMAEFRRRATYVSQSLETPFARSSLAGEVWEKIKQTSIALTACSSLAYPYPPQAPAYHIGSDSREWGIHHSWNIKIPSTLHDSLSTTKSITVVPPTVATTHLKRPWLYRR